MPSIRDYSSKAPKVDRNRDPRLLVMFGVICTAAVLICARLIVLMIVQHSFYAALASDQQEIIRRLFPERGQILVRDRQTNKLVPVAANRILTLIYADPRKIKDPMDAANKLAPLFDIAIPEEKIDATEEEKATRAKALDEKQKLLNKLSKKDDPYELLKRQVPDEIADQVKALNIEGIGFVDERVRYYPESTFGGAILGFVGSDDKGNKTGKYGLEGYFERELVGKQGISQSAKGAAGAWVDLATRQLEPSEDGANIILTIDPAIQHIACQKLREAITAHQAERGALVILDAKTGAVMAMCSAPDFDPNTFSQVESASVYNNIATLNAYEPGSVMKAVTLAASIDDGKITPQSTYEDKGVITLGDFNMRNSDLKAHGVQTMTQVLESSLNTGAFYAEEQMLPETFKKYLYDFGFGAATGIELNSESKGTLASLDKPGRIFRATASFGQGITGTVLQVADAFLVFANQGKLMKPYIVEQKEFGNGRVEKTEPQAIRQVISARTASLVSGMLVSVVEKGHGKKAGVEGYWVAGKTGTAQVSGENGKGYLTGLGSTIGTFAGFAPVDNPRFVMVTRIDRPKDAVFAETTAAPLFGDIAKFLLQYLEVPTTRK
jgi:cell division protein FtsI/penicillin-binding protein 2